MKTKRPMDRLGGPAKPKKFRDYYTITEVAREVGRDPSRIRMLEREGKIPTAHRIQCGKLSVRLFSPMQVDEIKEILAKMKPGRKSRNG